MPGNDFLTFFACNTRSITRAAKARHVIASSDYGGFYCDAQAKARGRFHFAWLALLLWHLNLTCPNILGIQLPEEPPGTYLANMDRPSSGIPGAEFSSDGGGSLDSYYLHGDNVHHEISPEMRVAMSNTPQVCTQTSTCTNALTRSH